jgi:hypothetical protein
LDAPGKLEKSRIVTHIMKTIRQASPVGAFVAFEYGRYFEVSQRTAREKVGGFFRDMLPSAYRSSAKAKLARKKSGSVAESSSSTASSTASTSFAPMPEPTPVAPAPVAPTPLLDADFPVGGCWPSVDIPMNNTGAASAAANNVEPLNFSTPSTDVDDGKYLFLGASFFDLECA